MSMTAAPTRVNPLNPVLYGLLQHKFGVVRLASAGTPANVEKIIDPITGRPVVRSAVWGEYYTICCPFCNDMGFKLWVNHRYGAEHDPRTGRRIDTHLAHCYKNNCLQEPGRYEQFADLVFGAGRPVVKSAAIRHVAPSDERRAVEPPGKIVSFDMLPDYHPAAEYLRSRGFDPPQLSKDFGIGVCVEPKTDRLRIMRGRIYIPVYCNKQLVGWQGRVVNAQQKDLKYYNAPEMKKNQVLYNFDEAATLPAVVVVEGVPSVWRLGRSSVCIFGKTMSAWQFNTILTTWAGRPIFLMFDRDAEKETDTAVTRFCQNGATVVPVILPDARDPADYSRQELRELLAGSAEAVSVSVDMSFFD